VIRKLRRFFNRANSVFTAKTVLALFGTAILASSILTPIVLNQHSGLLSTLATEEKQIQKLDTKIKNLDEQHSLLLRKFDAAATTVDRDGTQIHAAELEIEALLSDDHNITSADLQAICDAVPGCKLEGT
jgi:predicted PurR-regulated permease PerM